MVKRRSEQAKSINKQKNNIDDIDKLADKLADKPYGMELTDDIDSEASLERITITIPQNLRYQLEDIVIKNKRSKSGIKSVSALVREAIEGYLGA